MHPSIKKLAVKFPVTERLLRILTDPGHNLFLQHFLIQENFLIHPLLWFKDVGLHDISSLSITANATNVTNMANEANAANGALAAIAAKVPDKGGVVVG